MTTKQSSDINKKERSWLSTVLVSKMLQQSDEIDSFKASLIKTAKIACLDDAKSENDPLSVRWVIEQYSTINELTRLAELPSYASFIVRSNEGNIHYMVDHDQKQLLSLYNELREVEFLSMSNVFYVGELLDEHDSAIELMTADSEFSSAMYNLVNMIKINDINHQNNDALYIYPALIISAAFCRKVRRIIECYLGYRIGRELIDVACEATGRENFNWVDATCDRCRMNASTHQQKFNSLNDVSLTTSAITVVRNLCIPVFYRINENFNSIEVVIGKTNTQLG